MTDSKRRDINRRAALALAAGACVPAWAHAAKLKVAAVYTVPFEQQWVSRVHAALTAARQRGEIDYKALEGIASHAYVAMVRKQAEAGAQVVFGESFEVEDGVRKLAAEFPQTAFVMGSSGKPHGANFSVFDNYIHEPCYLAGMLAGGLTRNHHIGLLGGFAIPELNRLMNAFMDGAREVNPKAKFTTGEIRSWLNQPRARRLTNRMVDQGVDVMFAGTMAGVIETAAERGILAFGNIIHPQDQYPKTVVASALWHMEPTVQAVFEKLRAGTYRAQDFGPLSFMRAKGSSLSPLGTFENKIPPELIQRMRAREADILAGRFTVPIKDELVLTLT
jgi:basic membrane lipoprotein Med (substrate-binding protein (PBP1-ABC) superfamily)